MEYRLDLPEMPLGKSGIEICCVHVIDYGQVHQVAKLVTLRQIVDGNDVRDPAGVQALDDVAANEAGRAGNDDARHAANSW